MNSNKKPPLVVDLDGTLTPTDTLIESLVRIARRSPFRLIPLLISLLSGKAAFKHAVANEISLSADSLPYRMDVLDYLKQERLSGRKIILATAAHQSIAADVALHLGLFDLVIASNERDNLKGGAKLRAIQEHVGNVFSYAGDHSADFVIWKSANSAVLVAVTDSVARKVHNSVPVEMEFPRLSPGWMGWLQAIRVHQWLKNILIFVPLLTSFSITRPDAIIAACLAFIAFSLVASSNYIMNDLWDLPSDRAHPRKRNRPMADGRISLLKGLGVSSALLISGLIIANNISPLFLFLIIAYLFSANVYSFILKRYVIIDVIALSVLYVFRIIAGSVATGIAASSWLIVFSAMFFLSLALVKRCSELLLMTDNQKNVTKGRDYRVQDLNVLFPLGVSASMSSVVVFCLFVADPVIQLRYATPELLSLLPVALVYWLARTWIKTSRGEMHDDPLVYAIKDSGSRYVLAAMAAIAIIAHFVDLREFV